MNYGGAMFESVTFLLLLLLRFSKVVLCARGSYSALFVGFLASMLQFVRRWWRFLSRTTLLALTLILLNLFCLSWAEEPRGLRATLILSERVVHGDHQVLLRRSWLMIRMSMRLLLCGGSVSRVSFR